jgi:tetratricopeptide (TPR) repeat protein
MRNVWLIPVCMLMLASVAWCDTVVIDGIESTDVTVNGVADGQITLTHAGGSTETTNVISVESIVLDLEPTFNEAEVLAAAGKTDEAMAKYKEAFRATTELWVRELCELRRYQVAVAGAKIDQATEIWSGLLTSNDYSENMAVLIPTQPAAKGDAGNTKAMATLDALRQMDAVNANEALWGSVTQLMIAIAKAEEDLDRELVLSDELLARLPDDDKSDATLKLRLTVAESKIGSVTQAASGVEIITTDCEEYSSDVLSHALFIRGRGYQALAGITEDAGESREIQLDACVDYMYVIVFFGYESFAPEAAYRLAEINESLGHVDSALRAYELLAVGRIASEHPDSEYVDKAVEALERLDTQDDPLPAAGS